MSDSSVLHGKKRKRDAVDGGPCFSVSRDFKSSKSCPLPVLALRSTTGLPQDTPFVAYVSDRDDSEVRLHGESGKMEWNSRVEDTGLAGFTYFLAMHRKSTGTTAVLPVRPHSMAPAVRSYRQLPERGGANEQSLLTYMEQRHLLGTTFGTKKTKAKIASYLRNQVDVTAPDMIAQIDTIVKHVAETADSEPTPEQVEEKQEQARPVPPFNKDATAPKDAYVFDAVAPPAELKALPIFDYIHAASDEERIALLPFGKSKFVNDRLAALVREISKKAIITSKQKKRLRSLIYLSVLMAFRFSGSIKKAHDVRRRLDSLGLSPLIGEGVLARFTDRLRDGSLTMSETAKKRLTSYILVLCLFVDSFSVDINIVAEDLKVSSKSLDLAFKALGCKTAQPTVKEYDQLQALANAQGITISDSRKGKRAVLVTPLTFPQPSRKTKSDFR